MTKTLVSLPFLLLMISGCAARQKQICNQNAAYQHGYQAAQKGESVDAASTFEGQTCQDFDEYTTNLYKQDFKAGYFKGKKEYCSDFNYKKWGSEDGELGKIEFPNSYSVEMKICLQDPEYKSKASKTYKKSFNQAFCKPERLETLGRDQAKNFQPLKVPSIKKRCGKLASKMTAAMRTSYKEQMKTNCTTAFWILKGEEDAAAKKSKGSELTKVNKCPANLRDKLMTQYSKSYNERKSLLLEEEKLAFEKQKQREQMELERKKQEQAYELEKERLELDKSTRPTYGVGGGFYGRPQFFFHKGSKLSARCVVDTQEDKGRIYVKNEGSRHVSLSGRWKITYYNDRGRQLRTNDEYEHLSLSGGEVEEFDNRFVPSDAVRCTARLNS